MGVTAPGAISNDVLGAELDRRIGEASDAIKRHLDAEPSLGQPRLVAVLGSGLGGVVELLDPEPRLRLSYRDIPHVPGTAVEGHAGELVAGTVAGTPAILLVGRAHPYEGYSQRESTLLLRAALALGPDTVVLTNAAGGLNPDFDPGDVMLIADHINLSGDNPLTGPNLDRFGAALPAHGRCLRPGVSGRGAGGGGADGRGAPRGRVHHAFRPVIRDQGGAAHAPHAGRRCRRHEHGARGHRGAPCRAPRARVQPHHEQGTDDVETGASHDEVIEVGQVGAAKLVTLLGDLLPRLT